MLIGLYASRKDSPTECAKWFKCGRAQTSVGNLLESKSFQKFSDNIALPLINMASFATGEGEAVKGSQLLLDLGKGGSNTLIHYTNEVGYNAIMESGELFPSIGIKNARYGPGQYLTDIMPGQFTAGQTSRRLFGVPWNAQKITHFIEIDISGLNVVKNAPYNYLVPGTQNLSLEGRIVNNGISTFKPR